MLYDYMNILESIGLDLFLRLFFFLIGMAIKDVLKAGNVPRSVVVLFGSCSSLAVLAFIAKGLIQFTWEGTGLG